MPCVSMKAKTIWLHGRTVADVENTQGEGPFVVGSYTLERSWVLLIRAEGVKTYIVLVECGDNVGISTDNESQNCLRSSRK